MADEASKSLLSTHKSSDSGLHIHLHPLVLLTISDYITRHTLRQQKSPIVGALLGQQNGREITLEHAYECNVILGDSSDPVILNDSWFRDRLQQHKDVHKSPTLELVGWFTTAPATGPEYEHLAIHKQILNDYNETAVLLAFHPADVLEGVSVGGKLPLTIYESAYESTKTEGQTDGDGTMEIEGQDAQQAPPLDLRFRELPYSVETGEAEMISVDFVARGGGIATATEGATSYTKGQPPTPSPGEVDSKKVGRQKETKVAEELSVLSAEDEELIASLTARANAIKMLHTRIQLLKSYLTNLPPSYLTSSSSPEASGTSLSTDPTEISHPILRSIQALINRLPLLLPADQAKFEQERLAEKSNVSIVDLLGNISKSVRDIREMGRKFSIVEQARQSAKRGVVSSFTDDFYNGLSEKSEGVGIMPSNFLA